MRPLPAVTFRETAIDYLVHGQDIAVPLGPGNPYQQFTAQAAAAGGTRVFTTRVSIAAR